MDAHPRSLGAFIVIFAALCQSLPGLQIHDFDAARHLRFEENTFPAAPAPNPTLWAGEHVFSGVGWSATDTRKGFALISPRHFVGANHFRPGINSQIVFLSSDGELRSYTYAKFYNIKNSAGENTDIFIGELSENIPAAHNIPLYPVLDQLEAALTGREIVVYGRGEPGPRVGRGTIGAFSDSLGGGLNDTRNYSFAYFQPTAGQDDAYGEVGDSGSPSFIPEDGLLTVAGIHSAILQSPTGTTTFDSFILHYKDQIDDRLAETGHKLIFAPVPETDLEIAGVQRIGDDIVLGVNNSSGIPYDVQRTTDLLAQDWETVATSQTGDTWTGDAAIASDRVFWRLVSYPLPRTQTD